MSIIPIILSGGSGTRLWPVSRQSKPKQFLQLIGNQSLFQDTVLRCKGEGFDQRPIVVGADSHRFLIQADLQAIDVDADILLEPVARSSCAAIAAGCLLALKRSADAMVLVLAADHFIPDSRAFAAGVVEAMDDASQGWLVTFGIEPRFASTAFGYVRPGARLQSTCRVEAFVEKPSQDDAERYRTEGYLWNSGNFLFRADAFIRELRSLNPIINDAVGRAYWSSAQDLAFIRLNEDHFAAAPAMSVDYAVMEKTSRASVLPVSYEWSDIGSWNAVSQIAECDAQGNAIIGDAAILNGSNNVVHSRDKLTTLIDMDDAIVVSTRDSVLVARKSSAEKVKDLVARLREEGRPEADEALQMFRPWGNYERLDVGDGYQVKRIAVMPGGVLSLQKHAYRSEHWIVVQGRPEVTIEGAVRTLDPNTSIYVPRGAVHRLANRGNEPVVLIEVQTGSYLGEDDIVRLEDNYGRVG